MPRRTEVNADWFMIQYEIDTAPQGTKGQVTIDWAYRLGLSPHQLRARLRDERGVKKKSPQPKQINRELAYIAAEIKVDSFRYGSRDGELPTWMTIRQMIDMGVDGAEDLVKPGADLQNLTQKDISGVSSINRILREIGFRDEPSYIRYECDYALQEVQADWSFSKYFRVSGFDQASGQWIFKATSRALDYKKDDKRQRILIGCIMDSYSRLRYHRALIGTGESAELCLDFLTQFFNRPKDDLAFRHVAWLFRIDNGSLDSKLGQSFFDSIDRPYETGLPYNKTGMGKAERGWQIVWSWEQDLAMRIGDGNTIGMEQYNELLLAECIRQQEQKHPFSSHQKRVDVYQKSILKQDPRPETIDVDARKIAFTVLERTVTSDQYVSIDNEKFYVPVMAGEYRTTGRRIRVLVNKQGDLRGELLDKYAPTFELQPFTRRSRGDFTGTPPRTLQQQINVDLDKGISFTGQLRKTGTPPAPAAPDRSTRMAPPDNPIRPDSSFLEEEDQEEIFSSEYDAMLYVSNRLGSHGIRLKGELQEHFKECVINESLEKSAIDAELEAFIKTYNETLKTGS